MFNPDDEYGQSYPLGPQADIEWIIQNILLPKANSILPKDIQVKILLRTDGKAIAWYYNKHQATKTGYKELKVYE